MRALVAGWFSFDDGHATAGDFLARDVVGRWLDDLGCAYDTALAPRFGPGPERDVDWRDVDPARYTHVVFVCGPFGRHHLEAAFLTRFAGCRLIGLDLSMDLPVEVWNPFDVLIERDSDCAVNADIVFLSRPRLVPVLGVCLVEPHPEGQVERANERVRRLLASREVSTIRIDTRLDENETGLRSPAEIESLIARVDVLVTTRLHGLVLALKNGVPAIAIDPVSADGKICRQGARIGWPFVFSLDDATDASLSAALDECLTERARAGARACSERAERLAGIARDAFLIAWRAPASEARFRARTAPEALQRFVGALAPAAQGDHAAPTPSRRHLLLSVVRQRWRRARGA